MWIYRRSAGPQYQFSGHKRPCPCMQGTHAYRSKTGLKSLFSQGPTKTYGPERCAVYSALKAMAMISIEHCRKLMQMVFDAIPTVIACRTAGMRPLHANVDETWFNYDNFKGDRLIEMQLGHDVMTFAEAPQEGGAAHGESKFSLCILHAYSCKRFSHKISGFHVCVQRCTAILNAKGNTPCGIHSTATSEPSTRHGRTWISSNFR